MTKRFNPPPGWSPPPTAWTPPPGRQPPDDRPTPPAGWQPSVDAEPADVASRETAPTGPRWRLGRRLYIAAGATVVLALVGLLGGAVGRFPVRRSAALLAGVIGLIRPSWIGAPSRATAGIAAGTGLALVIAGVAIAPSQPVAVPQTATSSAPPPIASSSPIPTKATATPTASSKPAPPTPAPTSTRLPSNAPTTEPAAGTALAALDQLDGEGTGTQDRLRPRQVRLRLGDPPNRLRHPPDRSAARPRRREDSSPPTGCIVLGGKLNDPYTGAAFTAKTTSIDELEHRPRRPALRRLAERRPAARRRHAARRSPTTC